MRAAAARACVMSTDERCGAPATSVELPPTHGLADAALHVSAGGGGRESAGGGVSTATGLLPPLPGGQVKQAVVPPAAGAQQVELRLNLPYLEGDVTWSGREGSRARKGEVRIHQGFTHKDCLYSPTHAQ